MELGFTVDISISGLKDSEGRKRVVLIRHCFQTFFVVSEVLASVKVKKQREGDGTENVTMISDTFPTISGTFTTIRCFLHVT